MCCCCFIRLGKAAGKIENVLSKDVNKLSYGTAVFVSVCHACSLLAVNSSSNMRSVS